MTPPSNGQALGFRSRGVDLLYWCRADMDGRIRGMEAFVTPEPHHLQGLTIQPTECAVIEDASAGAAARRAADLEPRVGRAGQARAHRAHGADVVLSDLAELLAAT
jgi:phosphoglycolate phosphatase-like HAD superfamily hydrolase